MKAHLSTKTRLVKTSNLKYNPNHGSVMVICEDERENATFNFVATDPNMAFQRMDEMCIEMRSNNETFQCKLSDLVEFFKNR